MTELIEKDDVVDQRIFIDRASLLENERRIRIDRHIERYAFLRQFAKGVICDAACGCGYGSYLLATNPDVEKVMGIDASLEAIDHARKEYQTDKVEFFHSGIDKWQTTVPIDMLFSVETIEHIRDKGILPEFVRRNSIKHIILTYPSKKTTHYNKYHNHDYKLQDVLDLFEGYICYKHLNWEYEFDAVFLIKET